MVTMMILYRHTMHSFLTLRYFIHRLTRTCGFGPGPAVRFDPDARDTSGSSLRAGLFRHHVKQFHESSCSVASVASAINALLERHHPARAGFVTQKDLLETVRAAHWKERMEPGGHRGKRGLPLDVLGQVTRASLAAYGIPARVEVIHATGGRQARQAQKNLITHLLDFQVRDKSLIIAHFDQGSFLPELNIPHISPVGGFNPASGEVTVLDVDWSQPRPYKIPLKRFYSGISTLYGGFFFPFGYGRGGYVRIILP